MKGTMNSQFLPVHLSNAEFIIKGTLPMVGDGTATWDRVLTFCSSYRRRGICALFGEASAKLLHDYLQRSGAAFLFCLRKASDSDKASSKGLSFYDAVACGDFVTAKNIAKLSRR